MEYESNHEVEYKINHEIEYEINHEMAYEIEPVSGQDIPNEAIAIVQL